MGQAILLRIKGLICWRLSNWNPLILILRRLRVFPALAWVICYTCSPSSHQLVYRSNYARAVKLIFTQGKKSKRSHAYSLFLLGTISPQLLLSSKKKTWSSCMVILNCVWLPTVDLLVFHTLWMKFCHCLLPQRPISKLPSIVGARTYVGSLPPQHLAPGMGSHFSSRKPSPLTLHCIWNLTYFFPSLIPSSLRMNPGTEQVVTLNGIIQSFKFKSPSPVPNAAALLWHLLSLVGKCKPLVVPNYFLIVGKTKYPSFLQ